MFLGGSAGQTDSAAIAGTVVNMGSPPVPLRHVLVTLDSAVPGASLTTVTDQAGHFVFDHLHVGTYSLTAARPPYVRTSFGATRPGRPGTPIALGPTERRDDLQIALALGASVSGVVRGPNGEPWSDVEMQAIPLSGQSGTFTASAVTDDRGVYRIFGLTPGKFVVSGVAPVPVAASLKQVSDEQIDRIIAMLRGRSGGLPPAGGASRAAAATGSGQIGSVASVTNYRYAPIYYRGTADPDEAEVLALGPGEDREDVNLDIQLVPTVTLQGQVSNPSGGIPRGVQTVLVRQGESSRVLLSSQASNAVEELDSAGRFRFVDVLPGRYRIIVTTASGAPDPMYATAEVAIRGDAVTDLALGLQPALRLSGKLLPRHFLVRLILSVNTFV